MRLAAGSAARSDVATLAQGVLCPSVPVFRGSPRAKNLEFSPPEHDPEKHALGLRSDGWTPVFP